MASQLKIDQVGLPAGVAGVSRTDGLATGAEVTLTNTGAGGTTAFTLLWTPPGDTTATASLAVTGDPKVWTFLPTADVYGTYLIELVEDAAQPSEVKEHRVIVVRTPNRGLIIPALNELGDPRASLILAGSTQIEASDNNATDFSDSDLNTLQYAAWWRAFHEVISSLDDPGEVLTAIAPVNVTKAAAAVGVATRAARADHKHDVTTAAPVNVTKAAAAEGSSSSLARADHKHDVTTAAPVNVTKAAAAEGSSSSLARADHKHDITTAVPVATAGTNSEGTSSSLARADHVHETEFHDFLIAAEETAQTRQELTMTAGAVTTASDSPSTLGATRLDPALLPSGVHITATLKAEVLYSVTPGRTVDITIRDHTNSVDIHTFSAQTSATPAYLEVAIAIPVAATTYLVNVNLDQLGTGGERATVYMARLEHTWVRI